ncbi:DNA damage-binding protein 1 [Camellia lanceoleosa]|uniref:DNA damage-binding protein 1 n=1 Tax=Camellia lanceoleosa TaxID=1840588 RepID=A0ACC0GAT4_9ERIC|nr:DNA damage-binding protein 1 [Camellia lanceoleosa]
MLCLIESFGTPAFRYFGFLDNLPERVSYLTGEPTMLKSTEDADQGFSHLRRDRPTVIYSSNKKLLYSNLNLKEEEAAREEQEAMEKIAILASLTAKKTATHKYGQLLWAAVGKGSVIK